MAAGRRPSHAGRPRGEPEIPRSSHDPSASSLLVWEATQNPLGHPPPLVGVRCYSPPPHPKKGSPHGGGRRPARPPPPADESKADRAAASRMSSRVQRWK